MSKKKKRKRKETKHGQDELINFNNKRMNEEIKIK
jgi:hypothetical protein